MNNSCLLANDVSLYSNQMCEILTHIQRPGDIGVPPKIAIISPVYSSRHLFAQDLSREISVLVKNFNFSGEVTGPEQIKVLFNENAAYICEECQYLYERRPHGFDLLRLFLSHLVTNSRQIITTWNQYSWNFLSGFLHIERWFPIVISLPSLSIPELREYLLSSEDSKNRLVIDTQLDNSLEFIRKDIKINVSSLNVSLSLPYVSIRRRYASSLPFIAHKDTLPEELIIREIHRLSNGEPGIAKKIFQNAIVDDEIRFSKLPKGLVIPNLSPIEVFILTLILMYESPTFSRLFHSIQEKAILNSSLYRLISTGLVEKEENILRVTPEGFAPVVSYLSQRRMIW